MSDTERSAILALDSSTATGSVAVEVGGRVRAEVTLHVGTGHSAVLLPAVDQALRWAGVERADLAGVVVGGGPGSFTGLRIGAATAKGIVHALGVPLWSYSALLAVAADSATADRPVCALFDARRRDVYAALYRFADGVEEVLAPTALSVDELVERLGGEEPPILTGEGALLHADELSAALGARIAPPHLALPRASALLWLRGVAPELGRVADPARWEPEYVRASGAERIARAGGAGGGACG